MVIGNSTAQLDIGRAPRQPPTEAGRLTTRSARPSGLVRRAGPVWAAAATALVLSLLWARLVARVGGDLAAQWAWADFAAHHPGSAYNLGWYGGTHPANYSLLAPGLMALFGVRTVAVASATVSAGLLGLLVLRARIRRPLPVALWGAVALSCNVAAGRVTFALGCAFGLAAVAAAGRRRTADRWRVVAAGVLALLATAASPVAGLFVEVAAAALLLTGRRRAGWALAGPPPLVVLGTALLFPFHGVDPISLPTAAATAGCGLAVALLSPPRWRTVRAGGLVYALGAALTWVCDTPIGANVQRLALIFGGVVLLAALCAGTARSRRRTAALLAVFAATAYWTVDGDVIGLPAPSPAEQAAPLVDELREVHADRGRLEVVPMLNHWESRELVSAADLARGWNRQLDVQRNPLFYRKGALTAAGYHDWLQHWAVQYVALPEAELDVAGTDEAALIRSGPSWLREVWHDGNWHLYRFTDALPLAAPAAAVERADAGQVLLTLTEPGSALVRIPWSPWLSVHGPAGACLAQDGEWTRLSAPAPGAYRIDSDYKFPRGTPC